MSSAHTKRRPGNTFIRLAGGLGLLFCAWGTQAESTIEAAPPDRPRIAIIIDDMGDQGAAGRRALQLPGPITYAFLPHTPHSRTLAESAYRLGKEVMLHLPMQAVHSNNLLGPGALTLDMSRNQLRSTLLEDLNAIPHVTGINNHMGSLITRHPGHMQWLMEALKQRGGLYFVDSRTTHHSVARQLAREHRIPSRQRDIFLDDDPHPVAILQQFQRLVDTARRRGSAIGIGHPHDSTLTMLETLLPQLARMDITLVPMSALLDTAGKTRLAAPAVPPLVFNSRADDDSETPHQTR